MKEFRITTTVIGTIMAETLKEAVALAGDMTVFDIIDSHNSLVGDYIVDDPSDPHGRVVTI